MSDTRHQYLFTKRLQQGSQQLDELLSALRSDPHHISLELLDELASAIGELTLLLSEQSTLHHQQAQAQRLIEHSESLRHDIRAQAIAHEQITVALDALCAEVRQWLRANKQAA